MCNYSAFYVKSLRNSIIVDQNLDFITKRLLLNAFYEAESAHKATGCECIQVNDEQTRVYTPEIRREIESRMEDIVSAVHKTAA